MQTSIATVSSKQILNGEKLLTLGALARECGLPGSHGVPHLNPSTLTRWRTRGVRDQAGTVHRLEAVRCGSRWLSSVEAVHRLLAGLTDASAPPTESPVLAPPQSVRRSRAENASAELDRLLG